MATPQQAPADLATPVFADYAAGTPCDPTVISLVAKVLGECGNPNSRHRPGGLARGRIEAAASQLGWLLGARAEELVFTSGTTESCNLAISGVTELLPARPRCIYGATEHSAVRGPMQRLARHGADVQVVPVDEQGRWDEGRLEALLAERPTALVAAMLVNNETGVVNDLPSICSAAHRHGALVLCDAAQALGKMPCTVADLGCDLLACGASKCYGPSGAGALYVRQGLVLTAQIVGGEQQRGLRGGTEATALIAGFGLAAIQAGQATLDEHLQRCTSRLEDGLQQRIPDLRIHGAGATRLPGITNCGVAGLAKGLLSGAKGCVLSGGSACSAKNIAASPVLLAMGLSDHDAANALRISFGKASTEDDADLIARAVADAIERLRGDGT